MHMITEHCSTDCSDVCVVCTVLRYLDISFVATCCSESSRFVTIQGQYESKQDLNQVATVQLMAQLWHSECNCRAGTVNGADRLVTYCVILRVAAQCCDLFQFVTIAASDFSKKGCPFYRVPKHGTFTA